MKLFEKAQVKKATKHNYFMEFIHEITPFLEEAIPLNTLDLIDWKKSQEILNDFIIWGLSNLQNSANKSPISFSKPIKGVYFCLADDAANFSIHGSFYSNESEWAANADFYTRDDFDLFSHLSDKLFFLKMEPQLVENVLFLFTAFTLLKTLNETQDIPDIANAYMALGFCSGDELGLGQFSNKKFIEHIEIVEDGYYPNPSTAPAVIKKTIEKGDFWFYLRRFHEPFLNEYGLMEQLQESGEKEAFRISKMFADILNLNYCSICGTLKKTPKARLCLTCKKFTGPLG